MGGGGGVNIDLPSTTSGTGNQAFVMKLTFFAAIGGFLFGYDTGVVSGAMLLLKDKFHLSNWQQELVVSITVAGAIFGSIGGGKGNDKFGRRPVIIFSAATFTIGAVVLAIAETWIMLLVGRGILGVAIGLASMTVPLYLAESAPADIRGKLTVINTLFITGGQFIAGLVDGGFANVPEGWRYMLGLAAVPAIVQFVGFFFLPESPRWLVSKSRTTQARKVLTDIRATDDVDRELDEISQSFLQAEKAENPLRDFLTKPALRNALIVGAGLQAFQQLTGINTVMYYSATILKQAGVHKTSLAIWLSAAIAGGNFIFTLVGVYLVERSGRKKLLLWSLTGVLASLVMLGLSFHLSTTHEPTIGYTDPACQHTTCGRCIADSHCGYCAHPAGEANSTLGGCVAGNSSTTPAGCLNGWAYEYCPSSYSYLALLSLVMYIACFAPGMGPMPWTMNSEIYPPNYRSFGNSFATSVNWTGNLIISMTFLDLTVLLSEAGAFWMYAGIALLALLFVYFYVPETKGKSLEEIEQLFTRKANGYERLDSVPGPQRLN